MSENAPAPETSARMSDEVLTPAREAEIRRRIEWILDKKRHRPGHWSPEKGNLAEDAAFLLDEVKRLSDLVVPDSLRADTAEEALEQERICCNDTEHRRAAETTRAEKAEAERDALRALLREAPHSTFCNQGRCIGHTRGVSCDCGNRPCDCWKSKIEDALTRPLRKVTRGES